MIPDAILYCSTLPNKEVPVLIPSNQKRKITEFLEKNNASYRMWRVIPDESEMEKLKST